MLQRTEDVQTLYTSEDAALVRRLLDHYNVAFIYLGGYERQRYGSSAGATLSRVGRLVFDSRDVQVFAVEPGDRSATAQSP